MKCIISTKKKNHGSICFYSFTLRMSQNHSSGFDIGLKSWAFLDPLKVSNQIKDCLVLTKYIFFGE